MQRPQMPFYEHNLLKPYVIFDVDSGREQQYGDGGSRFNVSEVNMALALFQELFNFLTQKQREAIQQQRPGPPPCLVGIITPYRCAPVLPFSQIIGSVTPEIIYFHYPKNIFWIKVS